MSYAINKKAKYDYDFREEFSAGLKLSGSEVKSIKDGNLSLMGSYITLKNQEAYLINCHIGPYKYADNSNYNPIRNRKLLLTKKELQLLNNRDKGLVIIPLSIYNHKNMIKINIAIARARKKQDKREYLKKRDAVREIRSNT